MSKHYHYQNESGQPVGPFSLEQLVEMDRHGLIGNAQIRADGESSWKSLASVYEIDKTPPPVERTMNEVPPPPHIPLSQQNAEASVKNNQQTKGSQSNQTSPVSAQSADKKFVEKALDFGFGIFELAGSLFKRGVRIMIVIIIAVWLVVVLNPTLFSYSYPTKYMRKKDGVIVTSTKEEIRRWVETKQMELFIKGLAAIAIFAYPVWKRTGE